MTTQAVVTEIAIEATKWMMKHKKPIPSRSLRLILEKYVTKEAELEELIDYLQSKKGTRIWHAAMRDCLKG